MTQALGDALRQLRATFKEQNITEERFFRAFDVGARTDAYVSAAEFKVRLACPRLRLLPRLPLSRTRCWRCGEAVRSLGPLPDRLPLSH